MKFSYFFAMAAFASLFCQSADAIIIVDFSPANGGTQTQVTFSGSDTATSATRELVAIGNVPFDFINAPANNSFFSPLSGDARLVGSVSGSRSLSFIALDNDGAEGASGVDDLQILFSAGFQIGETLTGMGSSLIDIAFDSFSGGGDITTGLNVEGPLRITLNQEDAIVDVPLPTGFLLLASGLLSAAHFRRRNNRGS